MDSVVMVTNSVERVVFPIVMQRLSVDPTRLQGTRLARSMFAAVNSDLYVFLSLMRLLFLLIYMHSVAPLRNFVVLDAPPQTAENRLFLAARMALRRRESLVIMK